MTNEEQAVIKAAERWRESGPSSIARGQAADRELAWAVDVLRAARAPRPRWIVRRNELRPIEWNVLDHHWPQAEAPVGGPSVATCYRQPDAERIAVALNAQETLVGETLPHNVVFRDKTE